MMFEPTELTHWYAYVNGFAHNNCYACTIGFGISAHCLVG